MRDKKLAHCSTVRTEQPFTGEKIKDKKKKKQLIRAQVQHKKNTRVAYQSR